MRLSVLDQSIAVAGRPHDQSIRNTVALAQHCEALGYERFWVSEHHNHPTIVGTAPEIVIAAIAATTERIRIGSAGIMLPHYSPFKVAEVFRVLDALAPGRIDLGLGRAPGSDGRTAFALNPAANERPEHFPADVRDLIAWVHGEPLVERHPFAAVKAYPAGRRPRPRSGSSAAPTTAPRSPPCSACPTATPGSSATAPAASAPSSSTSATTGRARAIPSRIRRSASGRWPPPTMEEAQYHFTSRALSRMQPRPRHPGPARMRPTPPPRRSTAYDQARVERFRKDSFVGTGPEVAARIEELTDRVGVDEMAVVTWTYDEDVPAGRATPNSPSVRSPATMGSTGAAVQ